MNFLQQFLRIVEEEDYELPATILKNCGSGGTNFLPHSLRKLRDSP
jgi:hypothetical protein